MVAPVAAYVVAIGTMLFAGLSALTLTTVVKRWIRQSARPHRPSVPEKDRGLTGWVT